MYFFFGRKVFRAVALRCLISDISMFAQKVISSVSASQNRKFPTFIFPAHIFCFSLIIAKNQICFFVWYVRSFQNVYTRFWKLVALLRKQRDRFKLHSTLPKHSVNNRDWSRKTLEYLRIWACLVLINFSFHLETYEWRFILFFSCLLLDFLTLHN